MEFVIGMLAGGAVTFFGLMALVAWDTEEEDDE